jgi:hypothetical protein
MASGRLLIAEQCIDRQVRPYLFRGRWIESVTGRVLLHATDSAGRPRCGLDGEQLTLTGSRGRPATCRTCRAATAAHG